MIVVLPLGFGRPVGGTTRMSMNTTAANSSLGSDMESTTPACFKPLDGAIAVTNIISFLVNLFHLIVLSRLQSLRGTKYRNILYNISLADIVNTISVASLYSCYDTNLFTFMARELSTRIPLNVFVGLGNYIAFFVFMVASAEKYLAICKPYSYQSSIIVRRLPVMFAMAWLFVLTASIILIIALTQSAAPWVRGWQWTVLSLTIMVIIPNTVTIILLTNVGRELKRMSNQSATVTDNGEERKAAIYLIIVFTMEMIVFLLNAICLIILYHTNTLLVCKIWNLVIKAPHTMANTVIYGWRTKSYQQDVWL